jgi:hypothetical protein
LLLTRQTDADKKKQKLPGGRRVSHDISTDWFLGVSSEHCSTVDLSNNLIGYNHSHAEL